MSQIAFVLWVWSLLLIDTLKSLSIASVKIGCIGNAFEKSYLQLEHKHVDNNRPILENTLSLTENLFSKVCILNLYIPTGRKFYRPAVWRVIPYLTAFFVPLYMLNSHFLKRFFSLDETESVWGQFGGYKMRKQLDFPLLIFWVMGLFSLRVMLISGCTFGKPFVYCIYYGFHAF